MPDETRFAPGDAAPLPRSAAIGRALQYMQMHLMEPLSLPQLAAVAGMGVMHFSTAFRREIGMPPYRYLSHLRVCRAQALLTQGMPLAMVAAEAGFFDQPHMYRHFRRVCGVTPGQYLASARRAVVAERVLQGGRPTAKVAGLTS
jgi:transcriptional regulator GlxA family with amidase domain